MVYKQVTLRRQKYKQMTITVMETKQMSLHRINIISELHEDM